MKIYISGPITGTTDYVERFQKADELLKERFPEADVINPAKVSASLPENTDYEDYMKLSLCLLEMCDVIYMMEGWDDSKGALLEFQYAKAMGQGILYEHTRRK